MKQKTNAFSENYLDKTGPHKIPLKIPHRAPTKLCLRYLHLLKTIKIKIISWVK